MLAMKPVALIKKKYQVELPLQRVFEYRVFFEQASFLAGCSENKYLPAITKSIGETHYLATPQQKSIYVAHDIKKGSVDYNIPLLIHLEGNVCIKRLEKSLHQLLKKHESLRTTFEWNGANLFQQIHSIPEYKLTEVYDTTKTVLSIVDTINTPFDLQKDLLFRAYLVKARDGIICLSMCIILFVMDFLFPFS